MQTRAAVLLVVLAVYLLLAFGARTLLHRRATGSSGWRGLSGPPGSLEWFGGVLFALSLVAGLLAGILGLLGTGPLLWTPGAVTDVAAALAVGAGIAGTLGSQAAMGRSWRIGVDAREVTELVTGGPFRLVRNPIFTCMILAVAGLALALPTPASLAALLLVVAGVELHVRLVEEPYLLRVHGERYRAYARRVGRFVPLAGRLG